jgi:Na+/melibiose symporter-like transporter
MSKEKVKDADKLWRVIMFPLTSASSNVHNMIYLMFFMVFATEALKLNPVTTGLILTVSRLVDGFVDPFLGALLDKTETRFGKFRPFLVIGSIIANFSIVMVFQVSFTISEGSKMIWLITWYLIWVIGYSCMQVANSSALSIVTKNPKHRPVSGVAGGIYTTLLGILGQVAAVPIIKHYGGFSEPKGWAIITTLAVILNILLLILGLTAIAAKDKKEFFKSPNQKADNGTNKAQFKDYIEVMKINKPLQRLIGSVTANKTAEAISSGAMMYFYMYAVKNVSLQPVVGGFSLPMGIVGAFVAGGVAVRFGTKKAYVFGAWTNVLIMAVLLIVRPFNGSVVPMFVFLMATNILFRRMTAQNINPMIADIIDYHNYTTGKFLPGVIGSLFSFIEKLVSSFGSTIVGVVMGYAGYKAGVEPTSTLYWATLLLYLGAPMLGDLTSALVMKNYAIDNKMYKEMYEQKQPITNENN